MYKPAFLQYNNNVNKQISWKNTYRHFRPLPNAPKFRVAARTLLKRKKLYINGNEIVTEKKVQSLLIFFYQILISFPIAKMAFMKMML